MTIKSAAIKIGIVGDMNVGKSTLRDRLALNKYVSHYHLIQTTEPTSKTMETVIDDIQLTVELVELPYDYKNENFESAFSKADCCILLFNVTWRETFLSINDWRKTFLLHDNPANPENFPFILIGNKIDKEKARFFPRSVFQEEIDEWCLRNNGISYFEISAKNGTNVEKAFEATLKEALKYAIHFNYHVWIHTNNYISYNAGYKFRDMSITDSLDYADQILSRNDVWLIDETNINTEIRYSIPKQIVINDQNIDAVGIDLGTTRCCAAVNRRNGIETIPLENTGNRLLSSFVAFDEEKPKCGDTVISRMHAYAKSTIFDSKRIIGKRSDEIKIDNNWAFSVQTFNDKLKLSVTGPNGIISKYPEEVSGVLLDIIHEKCVEFQGKHLHTVVITVPASFNKEQKMATAVAAVLAAWYTVYLLPEPVAATFAYFINRPIPNNSTLLLFDLGGGTLDVCIFKIENDQLKIISESGNSQLGGRDFDNILINYFSLKLMNEFCVSLSEYKKHKLMLKSQEIKHNLSIRNEDQLIVEDIDAFKEDKYIPITRAEFENLSSSLLNRIKENITNAISTAELTVEDIDKVLYVGGGCRMPMIKNLLNESFSNAQHCCEQNPDEVVAIGAAYYAYYLQFPETDKKRCSIM